MGIGITELLIILAIVALLFGTKKLRSAGGDLGAAISSFRQAMSEPEQPPATETAAVIQAPEPPAAPPTEEPTGRIIEGEAVQAGGTPKTKRKNNKKKN